MNKTPNYQLNQWAKSDRVLMDDFNADNAKLDAALKANADAISAETSARISAVQAEASARASAVQAARDACPLVVLSTITLPYSMSRYDLNLANIDWNAYGEIIIYMVLKGSGIKVLLNGLTGSHYFSNFTSGYTDQFMQIDNTPCYASCRVLRSDQGFRATWTTANDIVGPKDIFFYPESTPRSNFKSMNFTGSLAAGCKFTALGVRG